MNPLTKENPMSQTTALDANTIESTATVTDETPIRNKKKFATDLMKAVAPTLIVAGVVIAAKLVMNKIDASSDN
jgi:hypothetical protein